MIGIPVIVVVVVDFKGAMITFEICQKRKKKNKQKPQKTRNGNEGGF